MIEADFFCSYTSYRGQFTPENLTFNANLQEFAQKITYICSLETGGKISTEKAYKDIKALWKDLKSSKKQLRIGQKPPITDEENSP